MTHTNEDRPRGAALPRVLVLDEEIPLPANTGKRIRTLNLLRRLASRFQIDLLVHADGATPERLAVLRGYGLNVHVANSRIGEKRGIGFCFQLGRSLFSPLPYSVFSHRKRDYRRQLIRLLAENRYALLHYEWTPYWIYQPDSGIPRVVSAHNVESSVWSRLAEADSNPVRRAFMALQARRMKAFERAVFAGADYATAVSEGDAARIRGWGCRRVQVVPNGVDLERHPLLSAAAIEPSRVLFVGSMDWRANQDAIDWFIDEVHPRLSKLLDYRLWVVGRNPPPRLLDRTRLPRQIDVTGEVEDVKPFFERSAAVVVPLRVGGGSRLKILEAFAYGRPVVSTTIGAEGLNVTAGKELILADGSADLAQSLAGLLQDATRRKELILAARRRVEAEYGWTRIADLQAEIWNEAIGTPHA